MTTFTELDAFFNRKAGAVNNFFSINIAYGLAVAFGVYIAGGVSGKSASIQSIKTTCLMEIS